MRALWLPMGLACLLASMGCESREASQAALGPYRLHCSESRAATTCVRFHSTTGAVRRIALERVPKGRADASAATATGAYELACGRFAVDAQRGAEGAAQCLRLDTHTGSLELVDAAEAPTGL